MKPDHLRHLHLPTSETLEWNTYEGWQANDKQVKIGEKATWMDGVAFFSEKQVGPYHEEDYYPEAGTDWDWYKD